MEPCSLNSIDLNGRFKLILYKNMAFYLCLFSFIVKENGIQDLEDILIPCSANYEEVCVMAEKMDIVRTSSGSIVSASTLQSNAREGLSSIVGSTGGLASSNTEEVSDGTISKLNLSPYSSSETYFAELKALDGEALWDKYKEI